VTCFRVDGVELREIRLAGHRSPTDPGQATCPVMYRGPLAEVTDEDGTVYRRAEAVDVPARAWEALHVGPAADQFVRLGDANEPEA
jgi:hypothetical protein